MKTSSTPSRLLARPILCLLCAVSAPAQSIISTFAGGGPDHMPAVAASLVPIGIAVDGSGNYFISSLNRVSQVDTSGDLTVFAGTGLVDGLGDGGPAQGASLALGVLGGGLAFDASGNLFIAESGHSRIRRVDAATGIITTVAGDGARGFGGDGGPATSAELSSPNDVAVDASGNLLIVEYDNYRVRRVDAATGIITTVAGDGVARFGGDGGPATSASLSYPYGVAVDASGNLFISDFGNHRIRRVDAATGIITTVAGNGLPGFSGDGGAATSASLNYPRRVAVDASGNLLIADTGNNRMRRVDAATGIITTVAGNGTYGFSGDGGPATSAGVAPCDMAQVASGEMFIADCGNLRIRRVDATGIINTVAGNGFDRFSGDGGPATGASLNSPAGVALDQPGNLFIADSGNWRIRRVNGGTGVITTVAGNGVQGFGGDGGPATSASLNYALRVAVDASGNLFIADSFNSRIRRVDAATGIITTVAGNGVSGFSGDGGPATSASLSYPDGVAVDASGNLFIADGTNYRIRRVDAATGLITTVAGNGTKGFSGDGGPALSAQLSTVGNVRVDASGNLFIVDSNNNRIRRVDASARIITTVAGNGTRGFSGDGGPATSAGMAPEDIAVDVSGNLFIADSPNDRVRRVDAATGLITTVAGNGTYGFNGDGGPATDAALGGPTGLTVDASGDSLIFADTYNQRVRLVQ